MLLEKFSAAFDEMSFAVLTGMMQLQRHKLRNQECQLEELERMAGYVNLSIEELFPAPGTPEIARQRENRPLQMAGVGQEYVYEKLTFDSPLKSGLPENDVVTAWWAYRPGQENATTVIYAHGWMAYDPGLWMRLPASWFGPLGYNVLMVELPHHMSRATPGTQSGELSITADLPASLQTGRQGVSDVRALVHWLRQQGVEQVGLLGKSLGGLISALTLVAEPQVDCAVLLVPAVDAGASLWESNYTRLVREQLTRQGIDRKMTRRALAAMSPASFRPLIDPRKILIIEATADRACPPAGTEHLAATWGCPVERLPFGHMSVDLAPAARNLARDFFRRSMEKTENTR